MRQVELMGVVILLLPLSSYPLNAAVAAERRPRLSRFHLS